MSDKPKAVSLHDITLEKEYEKRIPIETRSSSINIRKG